VRAAAVLLLALAGCASEGAIRTWTHERYAEERPAMLVVRAEPPLDRALYERLIGKGYAVVALGRPPGREAGTVTVTEEAEGTSTLVLRTPAGEVLYRATARPGGAEERAERLLSMLPAK